MTTLFYVENDTEWMQVRRRGRFAIERAAAASAPHLLAAISDMQERMIAGLQKVGFEYVDKPDGWEVRGPLPHYEFSQSASIDPGTMPPDPRDVDRLRAWERAEKARMARRVGRAEEMVDYELVAPFRTRRQRRFHLAAPVSR